MHAFVMTIEEAQQEITEEFSLLEDWMDKYEHIIELGRELDAMADEHKTEDNLIKGCQSRVWLHADAQDGQLRFSADSDAIITKGLVALMVRVLSNQDPKEVASADLWFIDKIGLTEHLSPTRSNGLLAMVKQMKLYGLAFGQLSNK
jgi:cysteine desulfuration protein SufE